MTIEYQTQITANANDARKLEELYQAACRAGTAHAFAAGLAASYQSAPDNLLFSAWHYRLQNIPVNNNPLEHLQNWQRTLLISLAAALTFAVLGWHTFKFSGGMPLLFYLIAPVGALFLLFFLAGADSGSRRRAWQFGAILIGIAVYSALVAEFSLNTPYQVLMILHLPVLAVSLVGLSVVGWASSAQARFAFLVKCVEVLVTGGLFVLAGGVIFALTIGLFAALGLELPEALARLLVAAGAGLLMVWALAITYDPRRRPELQEFEQGLSRLITSMMRLVLPLVLLLLLVYLLVIPFNFMQPFYQREALIVFNALLFAVMALLLAITPVRAVEVSGNYQRWLRRGMLALAGLTLLVSLYALAAITYRTVLGGITFNRMAVLGWNLINITLLALWLYRQWRAGNSSWVDAAQSVFSDGAYAYLGWTLFMVLVSPWLF